jgi:hypothetical protein
MSLEPSAMGELLPEATLEDCEQALHQVERNAAIQQGVILRHVRDHRLYKTAGFTSFEEYVEKRLGYTRDWADKRIGLVNVVEQVPTNVGTPAITNEGQARAIKPVLRDLGPEVAAEVLREAADDSGRITARSITEATARVIEPEVLTSDEWIARQEQPNPLDDVDAEDLIPAGLRFKRRFWKHMVATHDLLLDADFPEHFDEEMLDSLADFSASIARKVAALTQSRRSLSVISGGTQ